MTDLPIIFSGPMIRALLGGRKTQTRRVLKGVSKAGLPPYSARCMFPPMGQYSRPTCIFRWHSGSRQDVRLPCAPGDRLWVRETWRTGGDGPLCYCTSPDDLDFRASPPDGDSFDRDVFDASYKWRSPIHMPRWASRITLHVTEVRVERLQDISEDDAIAEGCRPFFDQDNPVLEPCPNGEAIEMLPLKCPLEGFRALWNGLHGDDAWTRNPWVVAITFGVHRGNIDQVSA